ncbi:MAG: TerB family tellurite resistance protein [Hypericibacter sp.]
MISRIKALLAGLDPKQPEHHDDLVVAVTMLLAEAARMDQRVDPAERQVIELRLAQRFGLTAEAAAAHLDRALASAETGNRFFAFTQQVKNGMTPEERVKLVEMLWEVVYADGRLDPYEDNLMRRVAGLLDLSDTENGAARKRVLARTSAAQAEKQGSGLIGSGRGVLATDH